jgi:hypothetical protein
MTKRLRKKIDKRTPRIYVNDQRYFKPDTMSIGTLMAYAVYVEPRKKVKP